jgi:hypothetical protein
MTGVDKQTAAELRAEVEQLRETVNDQQEQIEQLEEQVSDDDADGMITPSRRGFLEGAAATGSAGLLGLSIFGSASGADTSAGAYGGPGESADIYLDEILDPQGDQVADLDDSGIWDFYRGVSFPSANIKSATIASLDPALERSFPTPTAYLSGPAHGEGGDAFRGVALSPDGRVILAPYDSSNVGRLSQSLDVAVASSSKR